MAGETTAVPAARRKFKPVTPLMGVTWTIPYATGELELNDVKQAGFIPANHTLVGFLYAPTDMDSGAALVQKITVGATDVATGLNGGQTGAKSFVAITPVTVTSDTLVTVTCTTAAGTAVAGTLYLTPLYTAAIPL